MNFKYDVIVIGAGHAGCEAAAAAAERKLVALAVGDRQGAEHIARVRLSSIYSPRTRAASFSSISSTSQVARKPQRPMIMPKAVRKERNLLAAIARRAIFKRLL